MAKVDRVWRLDRYARLLQDKEQLLLLPQPQLTKAGPGSSWKHYYSSTNGSIHMALLEDNHLMISCANQIFESISLWEAKKWMKCVTKGDSVLFIYRLNDNNRRFRVQFSPLSHGGSSIDACKHCVSILSSFISVSEMPSSATSSQLTSCSQPVHQMPPSQGEVLGVANFPTGEAVGGCTAAVPLSSAAVPLSSAAVGGSSAAVGGSSAAVGGSNAPWNSDELMTVSDIARVIQTRGKSLGRAYTTTNFPTEQLGPFIRLCLTDTNFPAFVEAVENELQNITQT